MSEELKHTPEPWSRSITYGSIVGANRIKVAQATYHRQSDAEQSNADANRIVACVNACTGMADPQAEILSLRQEVERLQRVLGIDKAMADPKAWNQHRSIIADMDKKLITAEAEVARLREALRFVDAKALAIELITSGYAITLSNEIHDVCRNALANHSVEGKETE